MLKISAHVAILRRKERLRNGRPAHQTTGAQMAQPARPVSLQSANHQSYDYYLGVGDLGRKQKETYLKFKRERERGSARVKNPKHNPRFLPFFLVIFLQKLFLLFKKLFDFRLFKAVDSLNSDWCKNILFQLSTVCSNFKNLYSSVFYG